jgi:hypothetical protein
MANPDVVRNTRISDRKGTARPTRLERTQLFKLFIKPDGRTAGPAGFQETESEYREGEGDDLLYPRARPTVDCGLRCY